MTDTELVLENDRANALAERMLGCIARSGDGIEDITREMLDHVRQELNSGQRDKAT